MALLQSSGCIVLIVLIEDESMVVAIWRVLMHMSRVIDSVWATVGWINMDRATMEWIMTLSEWMVIDSGMSSGVRPPLLMSYLSMVLIVHVGLTTEDSAAKHATKRSLMVGLWLVEDIGGQVCLSWHGSQLGEHGMCRLMHLLR